MPEVVIPVDESFDRALRRFQERCERPAILPNLRTHRQHLEPGERRKPGRTATRWDSAASA